ncbi:protein adenylyltransferase SelO [Lyngbya confervoides]|uniref:protein adenylyltransferase SelO n=1 Tax=Lyngbya confervoides TaxID=207921 RepID=UPI001F4596FC
MTNPILNLPDERCVEALGEAYYEAVPAATFPEHHLRFRNDRLLAETFGLDPQQIQDDHYLEAFGKFQGQEPFLALGYHGYQFGTYNPQLGDGRGFLLAQVRGQDGCLYDFGTKGSGRTPFSRTADGRLTLKGGVREMIASEALHYAGVHTSRTVSVIETGESLWRGDEPSPTRSCVLVRQSRSHIRFGTFERLLVMDRPDLMERLLNHVIAEYYPDLRAIASVQDRYLGFYQALVERTAQLVAQWMSVGFCHAVLNTDNMSITGESFDYGPFAFIPAFDPGFTAAYFDHDGRYSYGNQPGICHWNLEMLQRPLARIMPREEMAQILKGYGEAYYRAYRQRMRQKLGLDPHLEGSAEALMGQTLQLLESTQMDYHQFFATLRQEFSPLWRTDAGHILSETRWLASAGPQGDRWRDLYHQVLNELPDFAMDDVAQRLTQHNPLIVPTRPMIEAVWDPIAREDNWQPLYDLLQKIRSH